MQKPALMPTERIIRHEVAGLEHEVTAYINPGEIHVDLNRLTWVRAEAAFRPMPTSKMTLEITRNKAGDFSIKIDTNNPEHKWLPRVLAQPAAFLPVSNITFL